MTDDTYQGWTNRETWATALWLGNDEGIYTELRSRLKGAHYYQPSDDHPVCEVCGQSIISDAPHPRPDDIVKDFVEELRDSLEDCHCPTLRSMFDDIGSLWRVDWRDIADYWVDEIVPDANPDEDAFATFLAPPE